MSELSRTYLRKLDAARKAADLRTVTIRGLVRRANFHQREWRTRQRRPSGLVLYDGPSRMDGVPIIVIATAVGASSDNVKTGDMVATYIMPRDTHPLQAVRTGADASVCGNCRHRPITGGGCYVEVAWSAAAIWRAFHNGRYEATWPGALDDAAVRFGSWGDPSAVPFNVWEPIWRGARRRAGYTHFWRDLPRKWQWLMASVDTDDEEREARHLGWRTFRVLEPGQTSATRSRDCPAPTLGMTCNSCNGCDGSIDQASRPGITIGKHGTRKRRRGRQVLLPLAGGA